MTPGFVPFLTAKGSQQQHTDEGSATGCAEILKLILVNALTLYLAKGGFTGFGEEHTPQVRKVMIKSLG